jgi:hypothetical protein
VLDRGVVCQVVKDQGGRPANGYRDRRGAECRIGFRHLRHQIGRGGASGWVGGGAGGAAGFATRPDCSDCPGCGWGWAWRSFCNCFKSAMAVRKERSSCARCFATNASNDELFFAECDGLVDTALALGDTGEQPLGGDHGFQMAQFGAGLRTPIGFQIVPKPVVALGTVAGQDGAAGAQAVGEGVEADDGFALGGSRTGRMLGILPVGYVVAFLKSTCGIFL